MSTDRLLLAPSVKYTLLFGCLFGLLGTIFTLVSVLTPLDYQVWLRLFDLSGFVMFACCLLAGFRVARQTARLVPAVLTSVLAGMFGTSLYTLAQYIIPYILFDHVVAYPFLYLDFTHTGMPSIKHYLQAAKGYDGVVGTTIGLLPYALPFATILGAIVGVVGGVIGRRWREHSAILPLSQAGYLAHPQSVCQSVSGVTNAGEGCGATVQYKE